MAIAEEKRSLREYCLNILSYEKYQLIIRQLREELDIPVEGFGDQVFDGQPFNESKTSRKINSAIHSIIKEEQLNEDSRLKNKVFSFNCRAMMWDYILLGNIPLDKNYCIDSKIVLGLRTDSQPEKLWCSKDKDAVSKTYFDVINEMQMSEEYASDHFPLSINFTPWTTKQELHNYIDDYYEEIEKMSKRIIKKKPPRIKYRPEREALDIIWENKHRGYQEIIGKVKEQIPEFDKLPHEIGPIINREKKRRRAN